MTRYTNTLLRAAITSLAVVGATTPTFANMLSIPFDLTLAEEATLLKCWESQERLPLECYELLYAHAAQALQDGNTDIAIEAYEIARDVLQNQISGTPSDTFLFYDIAVTLEDQSKALRIEKRTTEAMIALLNGLQIVSELRNLHPSFLKFTEAHAVFLNNMGALQNEMGQFEDALASYRLSINMMTDVSQLADSNKDQARRLYGVMVNYHKSGSILAKLDRIEEALCFYSLADTYVDEALEVLPANAEYIRAKNINQKVLDALSRQFVEDRTPICDALNGKHRQQPSGGRDQERRAPSEAGPGNQTIG